MIILRTLIALACLLTLAKTDEYCRALALAGGGNRGSYEAGVIWGLNHYGNSSDFAWDSVSGISAGGINTLALTFFDPQDGVNASDWIVAAWRKLTSKKIY